MDAAGIYGWCFDEPLFELLKKEEMSVNSYHHQAEKYFVLS